eukprot:TRINITY_DN12387_c0_g1_i1.p1 TRINITY_DN12387_c0_g1~~TRINITY_DN12387_c0_g1_i1.p1  ORF type:complete len:114 (-),score=9.25 TRINITY_DN12387_c0_g1_i1:231-572(-)
MHEHVMLKMYEPEKRISFEVTEEDRREEKRMLSQSQFAGKWRTQLGKTKIHYGEQYVNAFPKVKAALQMLSSSRDTRYPYRACKKWNNNCDQACFVLIDDSKRVMLLILDYRW